MSVFAMRTDDIGSRMETSVALVLASITLKFTVNEYTPKLPYPTLCDYFTWTCFYVQIVMGLSNPLIFQLRRYAGLRLLGRLHSKAERDNEILVQLIWSISRRRQCRHGISFRTIQRCGTA